MKPRKRRVRGTIALLFGFVGTIVSIAFAVGSIWFGIQAPRTVDGVVNRIEMPIDRVDNKLGEAQTAISNADALDVVRAQVSSVAEATANVTNSVEAVTESPLYGRLPVDTSGLESRIDKLNATATEMSESIEEGGGDGGESLTKVKGPIINQIDTAQQELGASRVTLEGFANSLKNWFRISAGGGFLLGLWGMFGQLGLARWGVHLIRGAERSSRRKRSSADTTPSPSTASVSPATSAGSDAGSEKAADTAPSSDQAADPEPVSPPDTDVDKSA